MEYPSTKVLLVLVGVCFSSFRISKAIYMGVCKNRGTPKSSILIGFSIIYTYIYICINHPFWGTPIFGNTRMNFSICNEVFVHKKYGHLTQVRQQCHPNWIDPYRSDWILVGFCNGGAFSHKNRSRSSRLPNQTKPIIIMWIYWNQEPETIHLQMLVSITEWFQNIVFRGKWIQQLPSRELPSNISHLSRFPRRKIIIDSKIPV